jgi:DNA-binding NarL/FixJ family response regulator
MIQQEADEMPPTPPPTSVVLVDDSGDLRALYRFSLDRAEDFEVVGEATDGLEGLVSAQAHQPDLVLLDISMPVMDGLQALPLIVETCPATTVVMLTGHGVSSGLPQKTAALGAAGYILKGTPMSAVLDEMREIIAQRSTRSGGDQDEHPATGTDLP